MDVKEFHAKEMFFSGPTWEVQPVTMDSGEMAVHLWPLADQHPDACDLTPEDAENLATALMNAARYARNGGFPR